MLLTAPLLQSSQPMPGSALITQALPPALPVASLLRMSGGRGLAATTKDGIVERPPGLPAAPTGIRQAGPGGPARPERPPYNQLAIAAVTAPVIRPDLFADLLAAIDRPAIQPSPAREDPGEAELAWLSVLLPGWLAPLQLIAPSNSKLAESNDPPAAEKLPPAALKQPLSMLPAPAIDLPLPPASAPEVMKPEPPLSVATQKSSAAPVETPPLPMPIAVVADSKPEFTPTKSGSGPAPALVPIARPADSTTRAAPQLPVFTIHTQFETAAPQRDLQPTPPRPVAEAVSRIEEARESFTEPPSPADPPRELTSPETKERPVEGRESEPPSHEFPAKLTTRAELPAAPVRAVSRTVEPAPPDPNRPRREESSERAPASPARPSAPESEPVRSDPPASVRQPEGPRSTSQPPELDPVIERATLRPVAGGSELQLLLHPEHLGRVAIRVMERGGLVEVAVRADNHPLKNLLAEALPSLIDGMHRQGFQISRIAPGEGESSLGWWTPEQQAGRGGRERHAQRRPTRSDPGAETFALEGDLS